ncbi:ATP-dependent helicase [Bacillus velezensis]|uniref:ATP-dependent helicase n=1 Tax=Bacillus velezensis TaxID=492670 RepID=UPI0011A4103F|nr:ATP-dependent helicase [Bacillus velezensis]
MKFTKEQKEAILTTEGNVVCIASAGSGKTSAFTNRMAYMIQEKGVSPLNILAVTFTKKAADEIQKRLTKMIGKDSAKKVAMGTFHSIAYRLLKVLDPEFEKLSICPDWWKLSVMNDLCKPKNEKNHRGLDLGVKAGELSQFISYQKANHITPNDTFIINEQVESVDGLSDEVLREAYSTYEQLKEESRQIDFDDMLVRFYEKLKNDAKFRQRIQDQYKYVMVDEYQDTSSIVKSIIKLINDKNVFVVGDWRQSIYSFINADVNNILDFHEDFENVKTIELNKNFRSTQNIVNLSNDIIDHSPIDKYKKYKHSVSTLEVGDKVQFTLYQDEIKQANRIADKIESLQQEGIPLSEIAILVRANSHTATFEDVFTDREIPFDVSKSMSFFDRKEVLDLISYARLVVKSDDDVSFRRVINSPNRYLSKKFVEDLEKFAGSHDMSLLQAVRVTPQAGEWKFKRGIDNFTKIIQDLHYQQSVNAGRFLRNIVKLTRYIEHIEENTITASSIPEKLDAVEKLCEMASKFPNITAFLAHISKIDDRKKKSKGVDAVNIVTVHSSKGLEWDVTFVVNVVEDLFPHTMNPDKEEERRLFYVACSRARKKLFISFWFYDSDNAKVNEGLFITELLGSKKVLEMKKTLFRGSSEAVELYPN